MTHKFKVGDKVKVVKSGSGCSFDEKGVITTITKLREDYNPGEPGYDVKDLDNFGVCIGESSFELVEEVLDIDTLKAEIAEKQRALSKLIEKERAIEYHFKKHMTWSEFADKLKEVDRGKNFIGTVEYVDGKIKFDICAGFLKDEIINGKKLFNYKEDAKHGKTKR